MSLSVVRPASPTHQGRAREPHRGKKTKRRAVGGGLCPVNKLVHFASSPLEAVAGADALIICTEWDEFKTLDYNAVYQQMNKPAFIFDGRLILDGAALKKIGFQVQTIGKTIM